MKIMHALRQAVSRLFNPEPGPEAAMMQASTERLRSAAEDLASHHDVFADLIKNVQGTRPVPKRKAKKSGRTK